MTSLRVRLLVVAAVLLGGRVLAAQGAPTADSAARRVEGWRFFPIPAVFYTPETKVGGGASVSAIRRRARAAARVRPTNAAAYALYTQEGQFQAGVSGERWAPGNRWVVGGGALFRRFPFQFFGTGPAVPDTGEDYTPRTVALNARALRRVGAGLYLGGGAQWEDTRILETAEGGVLATGALPGSGGSTVGMLSLLANWDTRDYLWAAERGVYVQTAFTVTGLRRREPGGVAYDDGGFGSGERFRRILVDARGYVPLSRGSRLRPARVLALQGVLNTTSGTVPFDRLPAIGGLSLVRGYYDSRFRDRAAAAVQAELRSPLAWRFGWTAFYGAGVVAPAVGELRARDARLAGGAGLRLALSRDDRLNARVDYGRGQSGSSGVYVTVGEAF